MLKQRFNIITPESESSNQTLTFKNDIKLTHLQLASIKAMEKIELTTYKCSDEKKYYRSHGFLKLPTGDGKTLIVLEFINQNKDKTLYNRVPFLFQREFINGRKRHISGSRCLEEAELLKINLIIVPHNIFSQWSNEIENIEDYKYSFSFLCNSKTINSFFSGKITKNVLLKSTIYDIFATSFDRSKYKAIERIIIDEYDSIRLKGSKLITNLFTWYVSATEEHDWINGRYSFISLFPNMETSNIFTIKMDDEYKKTIESMKPKLFRHVIKYRSSLSKAFLKDLLSTQTEIADIQSYIFERTKEVYKLLYNTKVITLFEKILKIMNETEDDLNQSRKQEEDEKVIFRYITQLNSFIENVQKIECNICFRELDKVKESNKFIENSFEKLENCKHFLKKFFDKDPSYNLTVSKIVEYSVKFNISIHDVMSGTPRGLSIINLLGSYNKYLHLEKIAKFRPDRYFENDILILACCNQVLCLKCFQTMIKQNHFKCPYCNQNESLLNSCYNENSPARKTHNKALIEKVDEILSVERDAKIIIFFYTNFCNCNLKNLEKKFFLDEIELNFENKEIPFKTLFGNSQTINAIIREFKNGRFNVLLVNSRNNACGLNIEFANHVIIYNDVNNGLMEQMIGRANRFNRKCELNVHTFKEDYLSI